MSWTKDTRLAIYELLAAALPQIGSAVDAIQANRMSLREALVRFEKDGAGGIEPPFLIYDWGNTSPAPVGSSRLTRFVWNVTIFYCTSLRTPDSKTTDDYMDELDEAAKAIYDALSVHSQPFQIVRPPSYLFDSGNKANDMFTRFGIPFVAVGVQLELRGGDM